MNKAAKRVNIVTLKMVRESSFLYEHRKIESPEQAAEIMNGFLADADREQFCIACLNIKNEPICLATISIGTLDSSMVHPRETYKIAITANAANIILFHNHPSGDPEPSKMDIDITKRMIEVGEILGIPVLDHIIIGSNNRYVSLKQRNLI